MELPKGSADAQLFLPACYQKVLLYFTSVKLANL